MRASDGCIDNAEFQRAFVAVSYAAGIRGDKLLSGFEQPTQAARALELELAGNDRERRAQALASELRRIVRLLEARRLA
jgi:hypothetical protein